MSALFEKIWYPATKHSLGETCLGAALRVAEAPYRLAVASRNAAFNALILPSTRVTHARVISVGNINVGGSGKTPATIMLAKRAVELGLKAVVLSRGYGRSSNEIVRINPGAPQPTADQAGDEPLLIAQKANVPVWVGADRAELARLADEQLRPDVILLDDGFQHRRLHRDLDIVVVDEEAGFGNGRLLPAGPLREPVSALERAGMFWVRASSTGAKLQLPSDVPTVRVAYEPNQSDIESIRAKNVVALTAIARADRFVSMLKAHGVRVVEELVYADHHVFSDYELQLAQHKARSKDALIVTTEKDRVRIPKQFEAFAVRMEIKVLEGQPAIDQALSQVDNSPQF